jgi:hypothetical protein
VPAEQRLCRCIRVCSVTNAAHMPYYCDLGACRILQQNSMLTAVGSSYKQYAYSCFEGT